MTQRYFHLGAALALAALCACRSAPPARPVQRPLILITVDTLRADHVNPQVTPALARLAAEAIAFETAVSVSSVTLPSHASLLTALYPPAHGVRDNQIFALDENTPTYAKRLKDSGYATAAFVSAIVLDRRYGLAAGFDTYDDEMGDRSERPAGETLKRAEQWLTHLTTGGNGAPFFLWVHLFDPHAPYLAGSYAAEVTATDTALGAFFDRLREIGLWDRLVLSVTSDHGESLGEHGESTHGFFVYDSTIRIPWLLKAPGRPAQRFPHQVRIVDVLPTMVTLAAVEQATTAAGEELDGVDLLPFLDRNQPPKLEAYAETWLPRHQFNWSELRAVRTETAKYIEAPEAEFYNLAEDPAEQRNLLTAGGDAAGPLRSMLHAIERRARKNAGRRADTDPLVAERFMSLGYIGYSPGVPASATRLPDPKQKLEVYELTMTAFELAGRNQPAKALETLRRAAALDPTVTQVHYLAGTILGQQERYQDAASALERAVALNPRYVTARFKLALAYLRLGRHDRAERALQAVLEHEPRNHRALHNLAAIAYARGDLDAAERLERQALAIDESYFESWNTLGAIYLLRKRPAEAADALHRAVVLNPASGQAHYNLALALRARGQHAAATQAAAKACSLDPRFCS